MEDVVKFREKVLVSFYVSVYIGECMCVHTYVHYADPYARIFGLGGGGRGASMKHKISLMAAWKCEGIIGPSHIIIVLISLYKFLGWWWGEGELDLGGGGGIPIPPEILICLC